MHVVRVRCLVLAAAISFALAFTSSGQENCTGQKIFSSPNCLGDGISADEKTLFDAVNKFRSDNNLQPIKPSAALSVLGNRRVLDLRQNMKTLTHSWSNCVYDINDEKTWPCLLESPTRLRTSYTGQGYETLYRTSRPLVTPSAAIEAWRKSSLHTTIILNQGMFADMTWVELGVAIDGPFAALWFGHSPAKPSVIEYSGLGVSFENATTGLAKNLSIKQTSSASDLAAWQGYSPDRSLQLDIVGRRADISDAEITIAVKTGVGLPIESGKKSIMVSLLKNIFPEWTDAESWIDLSIRQISENRTAWRRKAVRGIPIEILADGADGIKLRINSAKKPDAVEVN